MQRRQRALVGRRPAAAAAIRAGLAVERSTAAATQVARGVAVAVGPPVQQIAGVAVVLPRSRRFPVRGRRRRMQQRGDDDQQRDDDVLQQRGQRQRCRGKKPVLFFNEKSFSS